MPGSGLGQGLGGAETPREFSLDFCGAGTEDQSFVYHN